MPNGHRQIVGYAPGNWMGEDPESEPEVFPFEAPQAEDPSDWWNRTPEMEYNRAFARLKRYQPTSKDAVLRLSTLKDKVRRIRDSTNDPKMIKQLTQVLQKTTELLRNEISPEAYKKEASKVQGHPSTALKVLGYLMIALSIAIAIAMAVTVGLGPFSMISLSVVALTGGASIFCGRQKGLSQDMVRLASTPGYQWCR